VFADPAELLSGWSPVEQLNVIVRRGRMFTVLRATRMVGPAAHMGTVVTESRWPATEGRKQHRTSIVVSGAALEAAATSKRLEHVIDTQLRWWTEQGLRHLEIPSMGTRLTIKIGSVRSWPAVGALDDRRVVALRRVTADDLLQVRRDPAAQALDESPATARAVRGTHLGVLVEWPVRVGSSRGQVGHRLALPRLTTAPGDGACRAAWSDDDPRPNGRAGMDPIE
jgi:hypothetical protein